MTQPIDPVIWEEFLARMETTNSRTLVTLPGMPTNGTFSRKMRTDPVFAARVRAIRERPDLTCHGHFQLDHRVWERFFEAVKTTPYTEVCKRPGMPHDTTVLKKIKNDLKFAERFASARGRQVRSSDRYGNRYSADVWEVYLKRIKSRSIVDVSRDRDMPSTTLFERKRRTDPAFDDRAAAILGSRNLRWGAPPIAPERWQAFLGGLSTSSMTALCSQPGMPNRTTVWNRCRSDPEFATTIACSRRARIKAQIADTYARRKAVSDRKAKQQARPVGEIFQRQLSHNELYRAVKAVVPSYLPPITRDDIICDMVLAVLEGRIAMADLKTRAREFVKDHWRLFGNLRDISLDTPIWSDNATTVGERVSGNAADYWE